MKELKLKVCGMKDPENIQGLLSIRPDFIGFIFYRKSPRYVEGLDDDLVLRIPLSIKKVGVFVNESLINVMRTADKYGLEYIQLHGDEDLEFAKSLKSKGLKVIKVFRIMDTLPISARKYEGVADYFLFDTATANYGGSGRHFDWNILSNYNLATPFILSGGVQIADVPRIKQFNIQQLVGIDVNSRFEISPGMKDLELLKELKQAL